MSRQNLPARRPEIFSSSNLLPWCAVPYDSVDRSPAERARMFARLGFRRAGWDWRDEHVAEFPDQLHEFAKNGIELDALWVGMPLPTRSSELGVIPALALKQIEECIQQGASPVLWTCTEFGNPDAPVTLDSQAHRERIDRTVSHLEPLMRTAEKGGMRVGLYNHLGWFGQPEHQTEVVHALADAGYPDAGLVYAQHHGHAHLENFSAMWATIHPHVLAVSLNGMVPGAHWGGRKIHPYGHGANDVALARVIVESGWRGHVALISHTMDDAEHRLRDNLEGLEWVSAQLTDDAPAAYPPTPRIETPVWPH
ncbi:hypothetical protein [Microbacterium marmarense]|uniref:Xylose isomerase-like TIM barrel domain-containing protein n=1 Tax=Microbacterium marmarense TaxID=3122051 RepID=A0ABU8LQV5_9MICO